jgi:hypothetical protein
VLNQRSQTLFTRLRILAALLLASVAWGSTVEFTHHHGARNTRAGGASEIANRADNQSDEARWQDSNSPQSSSRSNTGAECSICQLHHNLATTLLSEGAPAASDETYSAHAQTSLRVQFLEFTATLHGRAPPLSFLS